MLKAILALLFVSTLISAEDLNLTFTLNKVEFVECEPIFAEWILKNTSKSDLIISEYLEKGGYLIVTCADENGTQLQNLSPDISVKDPVPVKFPANGVVKGWLCISDLFSIQKPGKYALQAKLDTTPLNNYKDIWTGTAAAEKQMFEIRPPEEIDAKAVKLIKSAAAAAPDFTNTQLIQVNDKLTNDLLNSGSKRFVVAAKLFSGLEKLHDIGQNNGVGASEESISEAIALFDDCEKAADSSFVKSLCSIKSLEARSYSRAFAKDGAQYSDSIIKKYPDSYAAQEAVKLKSKTKQ